MDNQNPRRGGRGTKAGAGLEMPMRDRSSCGIGHLVGVKSHFWFRVGWWVTLAAAFSTSSFSQAWAGPRCETPLMPPVPGEVIRNFAPHRQPGHWGVDLASPPSGVVRAPVSGTVTFVGLVAGRKSVTIAPHPRVRVSLSYLSKSSVLPGQRIAVGALLGRSGEDRGFAAVHLSMRVDGQYRDPQPALACDRSADSVWGRLKLLSQQGR